MPASTAFSTPPPGDPTARPADDGPEQAATRGDGWRPAPWIGWRRRVLVLAALLGCLALFAAARWLAHSPTFDAQWTTQAEGRLVLQGSPLPLLKGLQGRTLVAIGDAQGQPRPVNGLLLHKSPRWQVGDSARREQIAQHDLLAARLSTGSIDLWFDNGVQVTVPVQPRGYAGLGVLPWPLAGLALALGLLSVVVVLSRPQTRNLLFGAMAACQAVNLLFIAMETTRGLGLPAGTASIDLPLRLTLDAITGAAFVHVFALHPHRLPHARARAVSIWCGMAVLLALVLTGVLSPAWWWAQGLCLGLGAIALAVVQRSYRTEPNPFVMVMRRFGFITFATLLLVSAAVLVSSSSPQLAYGVAIGASVSWYLFLTSLMLLTPFLARSRQLLREFALLAGLSTVAASVDLLFIAVFSLSAFSSLAVAVFVALALYAGARQYILNHLLGNSLLTTERTFEHLYRAARDLQAQPGRHPQVLAQLLRELFDPIDAVGMDRVPDRTRVVGSGSALVVPLPAGSGEGARAMALKLRFAQRGQRLFTHEDARLADRVADQLQRAVAHDRAVEQGRHEERQRLAQDLHDDIGARLLTLMYQAPTPVMEDYIRHTLQDLKTLTRGLAAAEHRLSHAAAEWKTDLTQRLSAARAELAWACTFDDDLRLSVVQWSALTRILRELVSNALFHGHATHIGVRLQLTSPALSLTVSDNGLGRQPQAWSHGLGLGGVRKRVKLLGGQVAWLENSPAGIVCEVQVPGFNKVC